jgi:hypothetical protein
MIKLLIRFIEGGKRYVFIDDKKISDNRNDNLTTLLIRLYPILFSNDKLYDIYFRKNNNNVLSIISRYIYDKDLYLSYSLKNIDYIYLNNFKTDIDLLIYISESLNIRPYNTFVITGGLSNYMKIFSKNSLLKNLLFYNSKYLNIKKTTFNICSYTSDKGYIICEIINDFNNSYLYIIKLYTQKCEINFNNNTCKICKAIKYELNTMSKYENRCIHNIQNIHNELSKYYKDLFIELDDKCEFILYNVT